MENSAENTATRESNGGLLLSGNPGNSGGGRPKSEVRAACADGFDKRIPLLQAIADNDTLNPAERLKALDLLGKYGGLQQVDNTSGDKPLPTPVDFGGMSVEEKKECLNNLHK